MKKAEKQHIHNYTILLSVVKTIRSTTQLRMDSLYTSVEAKFIFVPTNRLNVHLHLFQWTQN